MEIIIGSLLFGLILAGIVGYTLGGGQSSSAASKMPMLSCPPGFSPSIAFKEKLIDKGIAYDEKKKAICILQADTQHSSIISYKNILAAAVFENNSLIGKSERTDKSGKELLSQILTEEIKALFQNPPGQPEGEQPSSQGGTSSSIDLRILVNNPEQPIYQINFLSMEAKKGGVIHNEAVGHVKNWQDLLGFLIRLAGRPNSPPERPQEQPQPVATT